MIHLAGRARIAALMAIVVGLAIAAAVVVQPALAYDHPTTDTFKHGTATLCGSCHPVTGPTDPRTNDLCTQCHTPGFAAVGSKTCWTCHLPGQDMSTVQTAAGCATGVAGAGCHATATKHVGATLNGGCTSCHSVVSSSTNPSNSSHHVVSYTVKPALSLAVTPAKIALKKTVTAKGIMHRMVTGGTLTILVEKKSGAAWKKVTAKVVTSTALETYTWKYKPAKKGSYRMRASVPASGKILAGKTVNKMFTVK
jgi:hypothetical protein